MILDRYPKIVENLGSDNLMILSKNTSVRSVELENGFNLGVDTEEKADYFGIFERHDLFIPFYLALDPDSKESPYSERRAREINQSLFDASIKNIEPLEAYSRDVSFILEKIKSFKDVGEVDLQGYYNFRHFSDFQQGFSSLSAYPHKIYAVVDLEESENINNVLNTIWMMKFIGKDDFGIDGTVLSSQIPAGKKEFFDAMLSKTPYERGHSFERIAYSFDGELDRID